MNTRTKPMFPRLRLLMMLFMLVSMASSLSFSAAAAPSTSSEGASLGAFQIEPTVEMCRELDTDGDLNLTPNEIAKFDVDLDGSGSVNDADRDMISAFCAAQPSMTTGRMVTICHALGGGAEREYEVITAAAAAIYNGHYGPTHQDGRDIIPPFTYQDGTYSQNWDAEGQATFENGCIPVVPPTPTPPPDDEDPGMAIVVKYYCEDTDITLPVVGVEGDYGDCVSGMDSSIFDILDSEGASVLGEGDDIFAGVELMAGTYTLFEYYGVTVVLTYEFDVIEGEETILIVVNPVEDAPTVDLHIYKEVCKDVDETDEYDPCVPSDAMDGHTLYFTVFALVGEDDDDGLEIIDYVEVSMVIEGNLGSAVVEDLPLADFYAVCEIVPEGIEGVYIYSVPGGIVFDDAELGACVFVAGEDLDEDLLIKVLFLNDVEEGKPPVKPEKPEKPVTPEKPVIPVPEKPAPTVTTLPSTGSGMADESSVAPWMLMTSAVALAGTGALLRKERLAA
jgi:hypothetical protein